MRHALSDMVGVWKGAARQRYFIVLGYDLVAMQTRAEHETEL